VRTCPIFPELRPYFYEAKEVFDDGIIQLAFPDREAGIRDDRKMLCLATCGVF